MRIFSQKSFSSAEERRTNLELKRQERYSTPLEAKTDALKLKELTTRFPFAKFYVTDTEKGFYYMVEFNHAGVDWMPEMLWYEDYYTAKPFYYFPRPFKIEMTTWSGVKKDITYLIDQV